MKPIRTGVALTGIKGSWLLLGDATYPPHNRLLRDIIVSIPEGARLINFTTGIDNLSMNELLYTRLLSTFRQLSISFA